VAFGLHKVYSQVHYYSDLIHGRVPDHEKSIEDMQKDYDANARIRGELLEKEREITYLRNLLFLCNEQDIRFTL